MTLGGRKMQALKHRLREQYGRPFASAPGVYDVSYTDGPEGDFFVTFHYRKDGKLQLFRKHFDKEYVFGKTCQKPCEDAWAYRAKVCKFGSETLNDFLGALGL